MNEASEHSVLAKSILKTLLYFDIFRYPLHPSEIFKHLPTNHVTPDHVKSELARLSDRSIIYPVFDFFSVHNDQALGSRRIKGNQLASKSLSIARKQAKLISKFPFVRAVMASGSLSKDYMDESSDLDFFIITKPHRLWITRMLLLVYKRVVLFNSYKYFCTNYLIDENHLEIEEKNIFTATEISTLLPLHGQEYYQKLFVANQWIKNYLPNSAMRPLENIPSFKSNRFTQWIEYLINLMDADGLEKISFQLISKRWENRYRKSLSKKDFDVAFKSKEYVSKGHPKNHQRKVLELYQQKLEEFGKKMNINWNE